MGVLITPDHPKRSNEMQTLDKIFEGFTPGSLSTARTVLRRCIAESVTIEVFFDYVDRRSSRFKEHIKKRASHLKAVHEHQIRSAPILRLCPECGARLTIRVIKIPVGKQNVKNYKSCWECPVCGWEEYSLRNYFDEVKYKAGY